MRALLLAASLLLGPSSAGPPPPDDTAALQGLLDHAAPGDVVRIPAGIWHARNLVVADKHDLALVGDGVTIVWHGGPEGDGRVGLELRGHVHDVRIEGLHLVGDGTASSRHAGIWSRSGQRLEDLDIVDNHIEHVTLGISVNADLGGSVARVRIAGNRIEDVVGTEPGYGYGIHVASAQTDPLDVQVTDNLVRASQRHAIYQARGRGATIARNVVRDHRDEVASGALRPAIVVARSDDVEVVDNFVYRHADGGILVTSAGVGASRVTLRGNTLRDARNTVPSIVVGSQDPRLEGSPTDLVMERNVVVHGRVPGAAVRILGVEGARLSDNVLRAGSSWPRADAIDVRCDCVLQLERNTLDGG